MLVAIKKPLRAKYSSYSKTNYKKETYYKLHPKQRPSASPIINVLFAAYSDVSHSVLLTNSYSMPVTAYSDFSHSVLPITSLTNSHMPVAAHSDFSHSVLPIASLTNSHMPVTAHSDFSHSVSPVTLLTNPHSVLPMAAHSKSIGRSALSAKCSSGD